MNLLFKVNLVKNLIKILLILLSIFLATSCSSSGCGKPNSSSGNGGGGNSDNGSSGGNTGGSSGGNSDNGSSGGNSGGSSENPIVKKHFFVGGFSYFETADGKHYIWGNVGELKNNGNTDNITTPMEVSFTIKDNVTGEDRYGNHTYYIVTDTGLYAWGYNDYGQVGNGESGAGLKVTTPYKVIDGSVNKLITNGSTVYAITDTGLYAWGDNDYGKVGSETPSTPTNVLPNEKVQKVITNYNTVYAITDTGLYAWGDNRFGQVGDKNSGIYVLTPKKVLIDTVKELIVANSYANSNPATTVYAITGNGEIYAWGQDAYGQATGNRYRDQQKEPYKVELPAVKKTTVKKLVTNGYSVYVITDTGLYAWGYNDDGQIGNGTRDTATPTLVLQDSVQDVIISNPYTTNVDVTARPYPFTFATTVYAITDTGLYAWGYNNDGQVGDGTTKNVKTPYKVR